MSPLAYSNILNTIVNNIKSVHACTRVGLRVNKKNLCATQEGFACYTQHVFSLRLVCTVANTAGICDSFLQLLQYHG